MKAKRETVGDIYHSGWNGKGKDTEIYDTLINDLAEDIRVKHRLTEANLIAALGYMTRKHSDAINRLAEFNSRLLILVVEMLKRQS